MQKPMSNSELPPRYHAYLLRFWEERGQIQDRGVTWRFSLEDPHTHERRGFATLEALIAFLQTSINDNQQRSYDADGTTE